MQNPHALILRVCYAHGRALLAEKGRGLLDVGEVRGVPALMQQRDQRCLAGADLVGRSQAGEVRLQPQGGRVSAW